MICKFDIRHASDIQRILNVIDRINESSRNHGPVKFTNQWESWNEKQRAKFLDDLKDLCHFLVPLRFADTTLVATLQDPPSKEIG